MINWRFWTLLMSSVLVATCILDPKIQLTHNHFRYIFVFDITQSMNVEDINYHFTKPSSRLKAAKNAALETIEQLPCDSEVGYAIFTEHRSFLLLTPVKVCDNFKEIQYILNQINWKMAWRSRSEITKGLLSAIEISSKVHPTANIIFFTDGHEAPPVHPSLRLKPRRTHNENSSIIIGVGGEELSPIPKFNLDDKKIGYWNTEDVNQTNVYQTGRFGSGERLAGINNSEHPLMDNTGNEHLSSLRESWLRQLANESGLYYEKFSTPSNIADLLTSPIFAEKKLKQLSIRWLLGLTSLVLIALVYLIQHRPSKTAYDSQ